MSDDKALSPAEALYAAALRLKQQTDAAMESRMNPSHGVGERPVVTPIVTERIFQLPPDNGGVPPAQPPEKQ